MAECPAEALSSSLPAGAKLLLVVLWSYAGTGKRFVWPSRARLGCDLDMNERTLRRHLAALKAAKWIVEAEGSETRGNPGWHLCDPPGTAQRLGVESELGETPDRTEVTAKRTEVTGDARTEVTERTKVTAPTGQNSPPLPLRNQPIGIGSSDLPSAVQRAEASAPGGGGKLSASAFMGEFEWQWRQEFGAGSPRVSSPVRGARRIAGLQEALDEHGADVVGDVILHAGADTKTHLETQGRSGLDPRVLAVAFRLESPSFGVLLDRWQRDTGAQRTSGAISSAPGDLDGVALTDEEARTWMINGGGEHAAAKIRELRSASAEAVAFTDNLWGPR